MHACPAAKVVMFGMIKQCSKASWISHLGCKQSNLVNMGSIGQWLATMPRI